MLRQNIKKISQKANEITLELTGAIDLTVAAELHRLLQRLSPTKTPTITLDLKQISYISSAGVGVLIAAHERQQHQGGKLVLMGVNEETRRILTLLGFGNYFIIHNAA